MLVRLFGGNLLPQDSPIRTLDESGETLVFYAIGRERQGPSLLAAFPGGRIEQLIASRRITIEEWVTSPQVNIAVAQTVAKFHLLTLPIKKVPWNFSARVHACLDQYNERKSDLEAKGYLLPELNGMIKFPFEKELKLIESLFHKVSSRIVFASNDLNRSNFLLLQDAKVHDLHPLQLMAVDYEFCSYNYRACDIGNHFAMKVYDFGSESIVTGHSYPSIEYRKQFIQAYIDQVEKSDACPSDWNSNEDDSLEHILLESLIGALATRLIDISWTLRDLNVWVDMQRTKDSCVSHLEQLDLTVFYYERKNELIANYPHLLGDNE